MKYLFIFLVMTLLGCKESPIHIIQTDKGKVEGSFNSDKSIRIFKGIPFAAPPVDNLRWQAPQPTAAWEGTLSCTEFSASPVQNKPQPFYCWTEEFIAQPEPLDEDCLYLNVWTGAQSNREKRPVFVWIYGGGLSSGSSNCAIYDGEEMAKQGLVFVSINYRVGVLGFMAHPELSAETEHKTSGNYGILDQIAALKWVQNNIQAFGGDPDNVTIAGQSAGAFSVNTLLATPLAEGLFHKAILQSGGILSNRLQQNLEAAEKQGEKFMKIASAGSIAELRKIPADKIQLLSNDTAAGRFGLTLDNYLLPAELMSYFQNQQHQQVPLMAGWVTGDGSFFGPTNMTVAAYEAEAENLYGERAETFLKIFPANTADEVKEMKSLLTLLNFAGTTPRLLARFNTQPTYVYEFGHVPPDKPDFPNYGAFHTSEVPFALHTWERPWRTLDKQIEDMMSAYWVNFAKTGNPNGNDLPEWKVYEETIGHILTIGETTTSQAAYRKAELDFLVF